MKEGVTISEPDISKCMLHNFSKQDVGGKTGSFYQTRRIIFMIKRDSPSVLHKCRHESVHVNGRESVRDRVSGHDRRHESGHVHRASDRVHHHENGRVLHHVQKQIFR